MAMQTAHELRRDLPLHEAYLRHFAWLETQPQADRWRQLRHEAAQHFERQGFPHRRMEAWRYAPLTPLLQTPFEGAKQPVPLASLSAADLQQIRQIPSPRLVFLNGFFCEELSARKPLPAGVTWGSLSECLQKTPETVAPYLDKLVDSASHPWIAFNAALLNAGCYLHVAEDSLFEEPLSLVFFAGPDCADSMGVFLRNLLVLAARARAAVVEYYLGSSGKNYFTNAVTEVFLDRQSQLDHYRLQGESEEAFHWGLLGVTQQARSLLRSYVISWGGRLARHEVHAVLKDEAAQAELDGLYVARHSQHLEHYTHLDHAVPHCTSHEFYRGILADQSQAVFDGRIVVHPLAQKTRAQQTNQNLMLSDEALAHSNPRLEIYADDVQCRHGATLGKLDEAQVFYLRSRGLAEAEARRLLTAAFADTVISRLPSQTWQEQIRSQLKMDFFYPAGGTRL